jgi:acyl carrier protein
VFDDKVREFLEKNSDIKEVSIDKVKDSDSLSNVGLMDSLVTIKLVIFLEEEFGINLEPVDFLQKNFDTIDSINDFVSKKKS